ncbi:hypothetical protein RHSIM_Rhsim05G0088200 [Rhododendron simsii]|uniref:Uncharacterized protein n=1 Tax=Rhododendron simsii TaxID=118357 RepID=A0A834GZC6_RHOSS|nr:hypothetical protein RHSIM_Rhsim05G0088200 [Rhododendron simsii]
MALQDWIPPPTPKNQDRSVGLVDVVGLDFWVGLFKLGDKVGVIVDEDGADMVVESILEEKIRDGFCEYCVGISIGLVVGYICSSSSNPLTSTVYTCCSRRWFGFGDDGGIVDYEEAIKDEQSEGFCEGACEYKPSKRIFDRLLPHILNTLYPMVQKLNLDEVRIKLANRMWTILRNNMSMTYPIFREFIQELHLRWTDFILVAVLGNHDIRVVVIDGIENCEKNYEWSKNFTVHVMITEKGLAKSMSSSSSSYQRLLLQDAQGNKMQSIIYGDNIEILANKLKLYHTYAITNAVVTKIRDQFHFLDKMHQLVISAKLPVEEIKIDGFSLRLLQFNFTPFSDLNTIDRTDAKIDVLFAVLNVGPCRKPNSSYIVDLQVIDTRLRFYVEIADQTGSIPATIFAKKAKQLYNITAAEVVNNTTNKLSTPKEWVLILKASMYTYGAISQCVFNVHTLYNTNPDQQAPEQASSQNLGPNTPKKRGTNALSTVESPTNEDPMEQDSPMEPFKNKHKKEQTYERNLLFYT